MPALRRPRPSWLELGSHLIGITACACVGCRTARPPLASLDLGAGGEVRIYAVPVRPGEQEWHEARAISGQPILTGLSLVLFDDVNGNGAPEKTELLLRDCASTPAYPSSSIRVRTMSPGPPFRSARTLAMARVTTTDCPQGREVTWHLVP